MSYLIEPLASRHNRKDFDCGIDSLNDYLACTAGQDMKRHIASAFVAVREENPTRVLGYYTLSSYTVELSDLPNSVSKKLPRYPEVPCTLLGRLARDHSEKGLGRILLVDALKRSLIQSPQIASFAVVVEALSSEAASFYKHFGFLPLESTDMKLYLSMSTVASLFLNQ